VVRCASFDMFHDDHPNWTDVQATDPDAAVNSPTVLDIVIFFIQKTAVEELRRLPLASEQIMGFHAVPLDELDH
jgi:hypothetical protein